MRYETTHLVESGDLLGDALLQRRVGCYIDSTSGARAWLSRCRCQCRRLGRNILCRTHEVNEREHRGGDTSLHVNTPADALRRQIVYKAKKILPTLKSLKYLATKLFPVATPTTVIDLFASQLWIDLNLYSGHINATSETIAAGVP